MKGFQDPMGSIDFADLKSTQSDLAIYLYASTAIVVVIVQLTRYLLRRNKVIRQNRRKSTHDDMWDLLTNDNVFIIKKKDPYLME